MQLRSTLLASTLCCVSLVAPYLQAADSAMVKRGQMLFLQCRACHDTQPSTTTKVGPNLHCLFGRSAAGAADYATYSEALRSSKVTWNRESLDQWLVNPAAMVPGTTMAFAGVPSAENRAALIAFLEQSTACN
ncbi:c-type cytochrome [Parahaliea maris]|nr:c-type cytochrome [Parahaliea maris]